MDDEVDFVDIRNYWLTCKDCNNVSNYPAFDEFHYGEFVGRSKNDEYVYVNLFEPIEDKFSKDFDKRKRFVVKSDEIQRKIFQIAIGDLLLDPDKFGDLYSIYDNRYCTSCGSKNVTWEDVPQEEVPEGDTYSIYSVYPATCKRWTALSEEEQQRQIEKAINDYRD